LLVSASLFLFSSNTRSRLPVSPYLAEAITAIYGPTFTGLERNFRFPAAFRADRREHLAGLETIAAATDPLGFPGLTASRTAFGIVSVALGLEEFLLGSTEYESRTAIDALQCLVLETQRMTSFP
jgi:hypothetical protein